MARKSVKKETNVSAVESAIVVEEKIINEAVAFINETANKTLYKGSIEIGEYVLKHFFEGDIKCASSKNPKKLSSFNKLCERDDLTVHPNRLGLMVRVAAQEQYLTSEKVNTGELSYTHKAALVKLDNTEEKINTIEQCINEKWSTRKLDDAIKRLSQELLSATSSSIINTTKKCLAKVDDVLKVVEDSNLDMDNEELSKMSSKRREDLGNYLKELKAKIEATVKKTGDISTDCDELLAQLTEIAKEKKAKTTKRGRKPRVKTK